MKHIRHGNWVGKKALFLCQDRLFNQHKDQ